MARWVPLKQQLYYGTRLGNRLYTSLLCVCQLTRGGVTGLPSNFLINDLLLLSANTGAQSSTCPPCDKHHEEIVELYCETCDEPICQACLVIDHRNHSYASIKDVFLRKKTDIAKMMNEAKPKISALRAKVASIEEEESKVQNNAAALGQEIDTYIDTLINKHTAIIERERQRLKEEVCEKTKLQLSKLRDHKESLVMSLSSVDFPKHTVDSKDKVELLRSKKEITSKIAQLRSLADEFHPCEKVLFKLDKKPLDEEKMQGVGKINAHGEYNFGMRGGEPGILYTGRAWQWCEFVITLSSGETSNQQTVLNHFKVAILAPNAETPFTPLLEDKGDGTRSFRYRPECSGDFKISISNEKLYGGEVYASPFIWKVLPDLHLRNWMDWFFPRTCTFLSDCAFEDGQHSWRVLLAHRNQSVYVDHFLRVGLKHPFNHSVWYWRNGQHFVSDNAVPSSIKSVKCGDVLVCFLDLDKNQFIIYNKRTKESDIWRDIEAPVSPYLYPESVSFVFGEYFVVFLI